MGTNLRGPNALLRKLRAVMAEQLAPQDRLDTIVDDISDNMVSDVCSVYVLRSDGLLELYASKGLRSVAVHRSELRLGQGLVGTIAANARNLNLNDAQKHPAFAYLPETGEEIYNSFLGVPILRGGRVTGVLVVQDKSHRDYMEMEVEALETTAMVLGELIATGELDALSPKGVTLDLARPLRTQGASLSDGIGLGFAVLHEPRVLVTNLFNERAEDEILRLREALIKLRVSIDVLFQSGNVPSEGEHREILEAYRMFAHDRGWNRRMEEAINNGLTAEAAVEKVQNDYRARMLRQQDPYLRDRLSDFDDLANRLLRELSGQPHGSVSEEMKGDHVIVARSMGAAELLDYNSDKLRGLVLEEAAPTSHVVIVARALGIPVVGQVPDFVANTEAGNPIIVDGDEGVVNLRPPLDVEAAYAEKVKFRAGRQEQYAKLRDKPAVTKDGVEISLQMNAGLMMDLAQLEAADAHGIGLFRTELQFMVSATLPKAGEQEELYRRVLDEAGDKPVTFRALDIGGDKVVPYLNTAQEENPSMGWRALRLSLDRPALLRTQIRALLKAAAGRNLRLMLPMVTQVWEIHQVRELIRREVELQTRFGHEMPKRLELGSMLEVPSLLYQLDELMEVVDFVSVGSNDLYQFSMACDRGNAKLANRYSQVNKSFLRVLRQIQEKCHQTQTPVTLCGEMAGRPLSSMAVLGLGYTSISVSPAAIGPVKAMLMSLDVQALRKVLLPALESTSNETTIMELLTDFADRHGIPY
ncbi:MAG: phosphoenolpyruvate--protein phosphotransferase [Pseudomonadota bacterium]